MIIPDELKPRIQAAALLTGLPPEELVVKIIELYLTAVYQSLAATLPGSPESIPVAEHRNAQPQAVEPKRTKLADIIRQYVIKNVIQPARERGETQVTVTAGEIHRKMGLRNRMPAVCAAINTNLFREEARLRGIEVSGPANGASTSFTFLP